jgi:hypothetical protein
VSNDQLRCGGRPVALLSDCLIAALDKEIRDKPLPLTDTVLFFFCFGKSCVVLRFCDVGASEGIYQQN